MKEYSMLSDPQSQKPINIFYCYAPENKGLKDELAKHLSDFRRQKIIVERQSSDIYPGQKREQAVIDCLDNADIILLLITPSFMDSYDCYEVEMERAIKRHRIGAARIIPILLRSVDWKNTPFGDLKPLPSDGKFITKWVDKGKKDQVYSEVAKGIKDVVKLIREENRVNSLQESGKIYSIETSKSSSVTQRGHNTSQISIENWQSNEKQQSQLLPFNHFSHDTTYTPSFASNFSGVREKNENWLRFRWFIFVCAIITGILAATGLVFHITVITELCIVPWVICLIFGLVETSHFDQWYWFVSFFVASPLTGLLYFVVRVDVKPHKLINVKQLIIMLSYLGYALFIVSIIIGSLLSPDEIPACIIFYVSIVFVLSAWLIRVIHHIRLNGLKEGDIEFFFLPWVIPFVALSGLSQLDDQLNGL